MYCSSCGMEVAQELNYCNRCGANLNSPGNLPVQINQPIKMTMPSIALAVIVLGGLGIIFDSVRELVRSGLDPAAVAFITITAILMVFGVSALFIYLWMRLAGVQRQIKPGAQTKTPTMSERRTPQQISAPPLPVGSVTEHTTRTFEPAYREQWDKKS
ncbi:MAG: hypothetical protein WBP93_04345 [Pyrinomonadaceae bacterium]